MVLIFSGLWSDAVGVVWLETVVLAQAPYLVGTRDHGRKLRS